VTTAFDEMQKHYRQRDLAAREWKAEGGKVAGYFCDSVPEELILAAGFFPLRISGDPQGDTDVARKHVLARFVNREDFVHSMFNMILTGRYDFLDFLIIPHARDSIHRLYQVMVVLKESNPALNLPALFFLDSVHTTFFTAGLYNRDRMLELKKQLEEWSGKEITNEALSRAIAITNENKMLLKKVAALRAADPPRISGVEALQIIGSSMFMLKEEHNKLLKQFLEVADKLPVRDGVRLFVDGSPLDNLQLYEIIESCKATVVAEDNCWGNRYSDVPIDTPLDPLEAIVDRYHNKSPCPRMYPMSRLIEYCLQSAIEAKAQGAICYVFKHDVAEAWTTPDKIKVLEAKGIHTLPLKDQPYLISEPGPLKASIKKFIEAI
jgi:benzoyl-CoA reductase/2-hydroxyglutaryl-CoA dehydratase subunit BcrC/BadD/HgdB